MVEKRFQWWGGVGRSWEKLGRFGWVVFCLLLGLFGAFFLFLMRGAWGRKYAFTSSLQCVSRGVTV